MRKSQLFKLILAFILLPSAVFFSIYSLDQKGFFQIDSIEILVSTSTSQKNFVAPKISYLKTRLNQFKGVSLWRFPLSQVADLIKQESWIEDFQISRSWPSSLEIEVRPQAVAFLIQSSESNSVATFSPVTMNGAVLEKIDSTAAPNAIIVHNSQLLKNKKIREGVLEVINSLPKQGRLHSSQISEIGFDKKEGYWVQLIQSDLKINLGNDQFEIKSARVAQVIDYLESRDLKARVIDANLSKKVLVRLQQAP